MLFSVHLLQSQIRSRRNRDLCSTRCVTILAFLNMSSRITNEVFFFKLNLFLCLYRKLLGSWKNMYIWLVTALPKGCCLWPLVECYPVLWWTIVVAICHYRSQHCIKPMKSVSMSTISFFPQTILSVVTKLSHFQTLLPRFYLILSVLYRCTPRILQH